MDLPQRNQLVWLTPVAWQQVLARPWDAPARTVLNHWHTTQLPVVVCTQRNRQMCERISLGLPAPAQWERRKIALEVEPQDIARSGGFPSLQQVVEPAWLTDHLHDFLAQMQRLQVAVQVYGSFGWQCLTGMDYVRPSSDLDLHVGVPSHAVAGEVARALGALVLPMRVDGELAFPDGSAVAWREYLQCLQGRVHQVLVKRRTGIALRALADLMRAEPCLA